MVRVSWPPVFALLAACPAWGQVSFSPRIGPAGAAAGSVVAGDFNGDRRLDYAAITIAGNVTVLLGNGDGSFQAPRLINGGPPPARQIVSADFNGDGKPDLAVTNSGANVVSVALGRGDGGFGFPDQYPCGTFPVGLVAADITGDGQIDLVAANTAGTISTQAGTTVTALVGRGDGTFGPPISSNVLGERPSLLEAGDFNRDGRADVVVLNSGSPDVSILISRGNGTFEAPRLLAPLTGAAGRIAVADFNADAIPDIAISTPGFLASLIGNGNGTFKTPLLTPLDGTGVIAGDFNGDGAADLASLWATGSTAIVLMGRNDGNFDSQQTFSIGAVPGDIALGDFNGDGAPDILASHQSDGNVTVLLSTAPIPVRPVIAANGIVNAASFLAGPVTVAPGEIVTIFGQNLGPRQLVTARLRTPEFLATDLDGTQVLFDGVAAPLIHAQAGQVSAVVPYGVSGKSTTQVRVALGSGRSAPVNLRVVPALPGVFTLDPLGTGPAAVWNEDGTVNSAANPAAKGSVVTIYATGEGTTNPPGADGRLAVEPLPRPVLPVAVNIANTQAQLEYVGAAPGLVSGLMQINARVPLDAPSGARVPLAIRVGDVSSQSGVTVAIR